MDVEVVVATYGGPEWVQLVHERAMPSAVAEVGAERVIHRHGRTLANARNEGLALVRAEWVIFLDADDELEPGYVEAMSRGAADLRTPAIRQVRNGRVRSRSFLPRVYRHEHECSAECLLAGNWLVIGTVARAELLRSVGGWEEWGWSEDWAMWLRAYRAGGTVEAIPDAVYRAHVCHGSRNDVPGSARRHWHKQIERAVLPPELWRVK